MVPPSNPFPKDSTTSHVELLTPWQSDYHEWTDDPSRMMLGIHFSSPFFGTLHPQLTTIAASAAATDTLVTLSARTETNF